MNRGKALTPKLRFPEFRDAPGWYPYILEELEGLGWVELGRGEVISNQDIKAIPGDYPIYSSSVKNNGLMGKYGRFMFDEELISWSVDGGGDFFHRPPHKFSVTNVSGYMRLNTSHLNYRFTASQLQALHASLTFDYQFKAHPSVIRKLYRLAIPLPPEQQKIAECLSSVDELVAAQARKLDALKTHKKGLMQQLFPREGETQPRLRFPEFQNAGEWVAKPLGEIFPITSSKRVHESDWTATGVPFYRAREIVALNRQEPIQPLFISEELYSEFSKLTGEIREGHLLVTGVGSIGVPYLVKKGDRFYFKDGNIIWLKNDEKELSGEFLHRLYETDYVQKQLKAMADVGTVATYTIDNAKKTLAVYPPAPDEQQRIADCLTTLDDLIAAQTQKLDALKTHKKGLMQQLFPSAQAVEA